ncbi:hypothetical protein [Aquiflexum lacus]|uniref:hypothetical protein n=1 Tax=Aquiflexum lacus TaxID=2483805 RepID=UPI001894F278|nr:hypothetical protein [Aquiflexum lacus]
MKSSLAHGILFVIILIFSGGQTYGFQSSLLFSDKEPLELELITSLNELRNSKSDTVFFSTVLKYKNEMGQWDSLQIELRARGNTRRKICHFPPIRIKIKKSNSKNTLFAEDKSLKLVLPCQLANSFNGFIVKEYMCYKFYESITPYHFQTRLVNLTLTDVKDRKSKTHNLVAFIIEDDDKVAKRFQYKISDAKVIRPNYINDTSAVRQDFFAFMIGNTDWSNTGQHNVKVMADKNKNHIPLPYDFDMAGFVGTPYAIPYDYLPIKSVQERLYRGLCRDKDLVEYVRMEYIQLEPEIKETIDQYEEYLSASDFKTARNFLHEFFDIIKNDKLFKNQILSKCLPNNY